jgi:exodeoxyribonuclease VII large subunit
MQILTVTGVGRYLKDWLESDLLLSDLWIAGEVSNLTRSAAGHMYFTLKDEGGQLRCVLFRYAARYSDLRNGDAIIAHGHVSFWPVNGQLQYYVDLVQPEGVGILHLQFERLKSQLEEEGLFDEARKRALPAFPRRIGVVTSPTGAVWRDICTVSARRFPLVELVLAACAVQGDGAAEGIARAIEQLNLLNDLDLIIVARGGGSIEELWAFNEERVARAIFASRVPVVSGVGHETDFTIADFVADLRAPTPSAAAEVCLPDFRELREALAIRAGALESALLRDIEQRRAHLRYLEYEVERLAPNLERTRARLEQARRLANTIVAARLGRARERVMALGHQLRSLSPQDVLARGYAVLENEATGQTVSHADQVGPGDLVTATVQDGKIRTKVVS